MREIKFRAWDDTLQKMFSARTLEDIAKSDFSSCNWYQLHVMQFTGLRDKDGKEIYDGDILFIPRRLGCQDGDGKLYIARWECCGFCFRKKIIIENGKKRKAKPCVLINRAAVERHSEIIGNVYEDSELLEGW